MPTRLNISLLNDDIGKLEELRIAIEKRVKKRLSAAEVVRIAIDNSLSFENALANPRI